VQFVKAGKELSVSGCDWGTQATIAQAFYALVIARVSPQPSIPGMRRSRGKKARQLVACILMGNASRRRSCAAKKRVRRYPRDNADDKSLSAGCKSVNLAELRPCASKRPEAAIDLMRDSCHARFFDFRMYRNEYREKRETFSSRRFKKLLHSRASWTRFRLSRGIFMAMRITNASVKVMISLWREEQV